MLRFALLTIALLALGCGDENMECNTTIDCTDDKESICDAPTVHEYENGELVEIRACTYITYENCFEKTVCKPREH